MKLYLFALLTLFSLQMQAQGTNYPVDQYKWVESVMDSMTLEEKVGQLFMVAAYSNKGKDHQVEIGKLVAEHKIGGLIFFQGDPKTQIEHTNYYQSFAKIPLMVSIDAEWGLSMRLKNTPKFPHQLTLGAIKDNGMIRKMGAEVARECKRLGVHMNLAPVVDINVNPNNPVINDRSFGENKYIVAEKSAAYMQGMEMNGILSCAKHFPGHGDTDKDSHYALPTIMHPMDRLNNTELYPFRFLIERGIAGIMTAHLAIPAIDNRPISDEKISGTTPTVPMSLSAPAITDLLKNKLNYKGLIFTDALNMKGVANYFPPGDVDLAAFKAGNDVLLFSENVPKGIEKIVAAVKANEISEDRLNESVRKILKAKYRVELYRFEPIDEFGVINDLNNGQSELLVRQLYEQAITLVTDKNQLIPLDSLEQFPFATVTIGKQYPSSFTKTLDKYAGFNHLGFQKGENKNDIIERLKGYKKVIIGLHGMSRHASKNWGLHQDEIDVIQALNQFTDVVLVVFGNPYSLTHFQDIGTILIAYEDRTITQELAAQAIMGAIGTNGKLPVSVGNFREGQGVVTQGGLRLKYTIPEELNIDRALLLKIDTIVNEAMTIEATPGCQIIVAKEGKVFFEKNYGYHEYDKKNPVTSTDLYDVASITKITATLPGIMKLYEEGAIDLLDRLGDHLNFTHGTDKSDLIIRDILLHESGLKDWIPFYWETLPDEDGNMHEAYQTQSDSAFSLLVAKDMYMNLAWKDTLWKRILTSELKPQGSYRYSDLGYYFFKALIEEKYYLKLDEFSDTQFYYPLGMTNSTFNPSKYYNESRIIPTELDKKYRNQSLQGYVHDMGAAMLGGVGGHAGLFSNANDMAKMMQMYLNNGYYGDRQFIDSAIVQIFTCLQKPDNRRGLGFDKPEFDETKSSPTALCVSPSTFGHTGFTGTCVWVDPEYDLIYIFLSNRVHPNMNNKKLVQENIRTRIQEAIYEAIGAITPGTIEEELEGG